MFQCFAACEFKVKQEQFEVSVLCVCVLVRREYFALETVFVEKHLSLTTKQLSTSADVM